MSYNYRTRSLPVCHPNVDINLWPDCRMLLEHLRGCTILINVHCTCISVWQPIIYTGVQLMHSYWLFEWQTWKKCTICILSHTYSLMCRLQPHALKHCIHIHVHVHVTSFTTKIIYLLIWIKKLLWILSCVINKLYKISGYIDIYSGGALIIFLWKWHIHAVSRVHAHVHQQVCVTFYTCRWHFPWVTYMYSGLSK